MGRKTTARAGWQRVRFGDVVRLVRDRVDPETTDIRRYIAGEHMDTDDLRIRRWGEIGDGYLGPAFHMRFKPGHVLYGSRRTYLRKVALADFEGICANTTFVLESADASVLLPEILPYVMQTEAFHDHSIKQSKGSVNPYVNFSDLAWYEFDLPSLDGQRRAISALGSASIAREAISRACDAATVLRDSCRDSLCALPEHALSARLETVCQMQNGKAFPGGEYCDEGIRLLRPGNLAIDGTLSWEASKTTHLPFEWLSKAGDYVVTPGDVLINLTAQSLEDGFMGRVCLAGGEDQCLLNQRIGRFIVDANRILPAFLYRCLQTTRFKMHAIANCEGSKVKHLFWSHLAKFMVPLPSLEDQVRVVEHLAVLDNSCRALATRQASAMTLHKQLLAQVS